MSRVGREPVGNKKRIGMQGIHAHGANDTKKLPAAQPASAMATGRASAKSLERRPSKRKFTTRYA